MNKKRPINLSLTTLKYPPMAIVSILHRISGILLFLLMPLMLYFLSRSLKSPGSFSDLQVLLSNPMIKILLLAFASALVYHLLAGIRHLLMDLGLGEHLSSGRRSATFVIVASSVLIIVMGVWLW